MVICSLIGDSAILIASIKYKAFNLHKIVVAFIQHVAVCDLMNAALSILPTTVSIFCNSGGSSKILNYVRFFILYCVNCLSACLIAALSLGKLVLLKYPLRSTAWSKWHAHKICAAIWLASVAPSIMHLIVDKDEVIFDYRVYTCTHSYQSREWKVLLPIFASIFLLIPNGIIIVSTVLLLNEARKVVSGTEETLRWKGIMTVVLTATVYTLSILPPTVYFVAEPFVEKTIVPGPFFMQYLRVANAVFYFHILANFFVYSLTVTSFARFLKTKFRQTVSFLSIGFSSSGNI